VLTQNRKEMPEPSQTIKIYAKEIKENKEKRTSKSNSNSIHNGLK